MGKLVQLEVNNFKSYRGHHILLFGDSYFTSIIGPNGSGKSNSMDAISFVLGIKSSHLRSTHLRDLIYRGRVIRTTKINADGTATEANGTNGDANGETQENGDSQPSGQRHDPQSAWVMAVFEDDAGQVHKWKRSITSSGQSEYRIDNRSVTQKAYNDALEEQSILIKARNFLVFQGDVENVASQNPKALTRLVEQISGSLEHKADYDKLKEEAEQASVNQADHLSTKRQLQQEINHYTTQRNEAEAYEKKVTDRDEAIVTHVLWKLFRFQKTMEESSQEIAKHQEELKEHKRGVQKYEQRLDDAKQAQAKVSREVSKTEKAIKAKEKEIEDADNSLVPIDTKIKVSASQVRTLEETLEARIKDRDTQDKLVQKWEKDLATVTKAQDKWEKEYQAAAQQQGRELSDQDRQEYNILRGDATKKTHENQHQVDQLRRETRTDQETVRNLKQKVDSFQEQVDKFEGEINQLQETQRETQTRLKTWEKERSAKQLELDKHITTRQQTEKQRQEYDQNLRAALLKYQEVQGSNRQSERERKNREIVERLKEIYGSGVNGRYKDLIKPKQKKYDEAVSTMLGWHMDAIIVDTERIAKDCIKYLKEQQIGVCNFIPLDTVTVPAVNQDLRGIHPGMRLGIDCIEYNSKLERAMGSACGNAMICDDIKIAKYLCYEKNIDAKAVTLDGTVIAKGGTITGGRGSKRSDNQFSQKDADAIQRDIDKAKAQMATLPRYDRRDTEQETLQTELSDLDDHIRRAKDELQTLTRNIASKKKELENSKRQLKEVQPKYNQQKQRLESRQAELKGFQDAVDQVTDQIFAAWCQRLGYASIRDYEYQHGQAELEATEKRLEFTKHKNNLQTYRDRHLEQRRILDERIQTIQTQIERQQNNISEYEAEKEELQNSIDELKGELEVLQAKHQELTAKLAERTRIVKEARHELDKRSESIKSVLKEVDSQEAKFKREAANRYALLRKCRVDEIQIPLTEDSAPLTSLPLGAQVDPDAMDVDEEDDLEATQVFQPEVNDYGIEVDFDELDDSLKEDDDPKACDSRLQDKISTLNAEIEKANPNMRAGDKLAAAEQRKRETDRVFQTAQDAAKTARDAFQSVKQKRQDLFTKAFDHIRENISGTYKDLTKSPEFPLGGQAYLDMEDSTEPYNAGLKYHAMPPLKRFRDMEHLSGGEKTIAALALLFAIHSYQPSPFFVLDEVDAALDNVNVGRVARYVREHASPGMQFIVISLKAGFFQESESLVGVMRDQSKMSSKVVSLDLRKYQSS